MSHDSIEAIFEHGGFRPLTNEPINPSEGQKVKLVVQKTNESNDILSLITHIYDGLNEEEITSIEKHFQRRENFFTPKKSISLQLNLP